MVTLFTDILITYIHTTDFDIFFILQIDSLKTFITMSIAFPSNVSFFTKFKLSTFFLKWVLEPDLFCVNSFYIRLFLARKGILPRVRSYTTIWHLKKRVLQQWLLNDTLQIFWPSLANGVIILSHFATSEVYVTIY